MRADADTCLIGSERAVRLVFQISILQGRGPPSGQSEALCPYSPGLPTGGGTSLRLILSLLTHAEDKDGVNAAESA